MFKPTPVCFGARRLPLTSKQGHNYYKGNRVGALGRHDRHGNYIIDYDRVRTYVVPEALHQSKLTPFVPAELPRLKGRYPDSKGGSGFGPLAYLKAWNKSDKFPVNSKGKAEVLEARYKAASLSVAPTLFSQSNPPPKGKMIIVDKKKAQKLRRAKIRGSKYLKKLAKRREKASKKEPALL